MNEPEADVAYRPCPLVDTALTPAPDVDMPSYPEPELELFVSAHGPESEHVSGFGVTVASTVAPVAPDRINGNANKAQRTIAETTIRNGINDLHRTAANATREFEKSLR